MEIFEGTPRDKFYDVIFNAESDLVKEELENVLSRLIALEELAIKNNINENEIFTYMMQNQDEIKNGLNDKFIEFVFKIVSQNG